jgi:predicted AAA+ superfamily ATPase
VYSLTRDTEHIFIWTQVSHIKIIEKIQIQIQIQKREKNKIQKSKKRIEILFYKMIEGKKRNVITSSSDQEGEEVNPVVHIGR